MPSTFCPTCGANIKVSTKRRMTITFLGRAVLAELRRKGEL